MNDKTEFKFLQLKLINTIELKDIFHDFEIVNLFIFSICSFGIA